MPRDINDVMKDHTSEIMALPGVVGIYIGQLDNGTLCITVMIVEENETLRKQIPRELEGHPVVIEVTGEIKPLEK